jgi:hypothetical protein
VEFSVAASAGSTGMRAPAATTAAVYKAPPSAPRLEEAEGASAAAASLPRARGPDTSLLDDDRSHADGRESYTGGAVSAARSSARGPASRLGPNASIFDEEDAAAAHQQSAKRSRPNVSLTEGDDYLGGDGRGGAAVGHLGDGRLGPAGAKSANDGAYGRQPAGLHTSLSQTGSVSGSVADGHELDAAGTQGSFVPGEFKQEEVEHEEYDGEGDARGYHHAAGTSGGGGGAGRASTYGHNTAVGASSGNATAASGTYGARSAHAVGASGTYGARSAHAVGAPSAAHGRGSSAVPGHNSVTRFHIPPNVSLTQDTPAALDESQAL